MSPRFFLAKDPMPKLIVFDDIEMIRKVKICRIDPSRDVHSRCVY